MIFALIGTESLLVRRALQKLLAERLSPTAKDFNFDSFEGNEATAKKVMEIAGTLPVFAERRVILIRGAEGIKKGEMEGLDSQFAKFPETTDLILTAEKADKRLGFWQKIEKNGKVREFKPLYPREVPGWIVQEGTAMGLSVSPDAAQWMGESLGNDLALLFSTLEKLRLLVGDKKKVALADVESCVSSISWKSLFDLTDAVGGRDLSKALRLFSGMLSEGESPVALLGLMARHFRILSKVKEGDSGGVSPYFLQNYQRQASQFKKEELGEKREKIFQADRGLKSSPLGMELIFERLLFDLCR
jgi:DNA polymerase-3 subunit delta